jgi:tetratricopeptide (TPR) repeat protein
MDLAITMYDKMVSCINLGDNQMLIKNSQEKKESALKDCIKAIELNPTYTKALFRRAKLYEELGQLDKALADYKELDKLEPNNAEVKAALATLPKRIEEQTEKLKAEMLSKYSVS